VSFLLSWRRLHIDAKPLENSYGQRRRQRTPRDQPCPRLWSYRLDCCVTYKTSEICGPMVRIAQRGIWADDPTDGHSGRTLLVNANGDSVANGSAISSATVIRATAVDLTVNCHFMTQPPLWTHDGRHKSKAALSRSERTKTLLLRTIR
jgi:hypothetical protein